MTDRSEIDAAWDDLLGEEKPAAKTDEAAAKPKIRVPPLPKLGDATKAAPLGPPLGPPSIRAEAPKPSTSILARDPSQAPLLGSIVPLVPPPPEYTPPESSTEVPLEVGSGIGIDFDEEDEEEIEVDASAHALSLVGANPGDELVDIEVEESGAHLSQVEAIPWSSPARLATPAIEVLRTRTPTTGSNPIVPVEPRRSAPFAAVTVSAPSRMPLWIGLGVAAVIIVGTVLWFGGSEEPKEASEVATAKASGDEEPVTSPSPGKQEPDVKPGSKPGSKGDADRARDPIAASDTVETEAQAPPKASKLVDPPPPAAGAAPSSESYDSAAAEYEASGSAEALLAMTAAACELDDGPKAREAFRKLKGPALRSQALIACRDAGIDVTAKVEGHTGPERLRQAQRALDAGDAARALVLARASNKIERSSAAMLLASLAACTTGDAHEAKRLLPHVAKKARPKLHADCALLGVTLE